MRPILHDDLVTQGLAEPSTAPTNLVKKQVISKGDIESALD